jgi:hypothetical protein
MLVFLQGGPSAVPSYSVGLACDPRSDGVINFPSGQSRDHNFPGGGNIPNPTVSIAPMMVVRYMIRYDPPPLGDGETPNLWRSPTGGVNPDSTCGTGGGGGGTGTDGYQLVARGIEDLQVVYIMADAPAPGGTRLTSPPIVVKGTTSTLVRSVEVTLVARTLGQENLHGATDPAGGPRAGMPRAVRQLLRSVITPRAVLLGMGQQSPAPVWQ